MPLPTSCAILVSRQALRPCAATPWVQGVVAAVHWAAAEGLTVNVSVGTTVWDLLTVAAAQAGARIRIFVPTHPHLPFDTACERILREYELGPVRFEFVPVTGDSDRYRAMALRDRILVAASQVLVPVSIRPGGLLDGLVRAAEPDVRIVRDFALPYSVRDHGLKYAITAGDLSAEAAAMTRTHLVHWTRASNGPWPGETIASYCRAVLASQSYPRDAFAGLRNMLATGRITASARHMPGNTACVSFTAKTPAEFAPHMRWRARYREMSFEPYGIGIASWAASDAGLRPVVYGPAAPGATPVWLTQGQGAITLWCDEEEWRCKGDFALGALPPEAVVAFCRTPHEAGSLRQQFGIQAIAVCRGDSNLYA